MKRNTKIINKGTYLVSEAFRGQLSEKSECIVMDNTISPVPAHNKKVKVSYYITENSSLLVGLNTVALFKIRKRPAANQALQLECEY